MQIEFGVTRVVLLTRRWAFKLPTLSCWRLFLHGLLANMQEVLWSGHSEKLCPVVFSIWGGWMVVMPRCEPVTEADVDTSEFKNLPLDHKIENFGRHQGRVVLLDYGS